MAAPKGTPAPVVEKLHKEITAALSTDAVKAQFAKDASEVAFMSSAEFSAFIAAETDKWGKVVKAAGVKAE